MIRLSALASLLLLASCSAGFNHEWRQVADAQKGATPRDLTGAWQGTWRSERNGHHGELKCVVSEVAVRSQNGPGSTQKFRYHATFMKMLSASYEVTHVVKPTRGGFVFSGDQQITGLGGGLYHYEGKGTPGEFRATYRCPFDHGVFELKRP